MLSIVFITLIFLAISIYHLPLRFKVEYENREEKDFLYLTFFIIPGILVYRTKFSPYTEKLLEPKVTFSGEVETTFDTDLAKQRKKNFKPQIFVKKVANLLFQNLSFIESFILFKKILRKNKAFLKKVHCEKFLWVSEIGFSDPFLTSLVTGLLWSFKNFIFHKTSKYLVVDIPGPQINVVPNFLEEKIDFRIDCIFKAKMGDIIIKTISLLFLVVSFRFRKGGK